MDAGLRTRHQVFGSFATIWLVAATAALGQSQPASSGDSAADPAPTRDVVVESDLEIFWLRGESGELVPVADLTVEEYTRLRLLEKELIPMAAAPEVYTFQGDIRFTGSANADEAQFTVQFNIRFRDYEDADTRSWVRVPLRLNQTILMPGAKYVGPGDFFITYEKQGDGYVAWLRAGPKSMHAITLTIKLPVVRAAGRLRVAMLTPPRPTQIQLEVPGTKLDVTTNNIEENILTSRPLSNEKTRIAVENVGGPIEITWRKKNQTAPVLEATADTRATINGQQIDYETNLRVRSFGAPIRTFDVRLPADAFLIPEPTPGVNVEVIAEPQRKGRILRVSRNDGKEETALEVSLKAFSISTDKLLVGQRELAGFEVLGAVKQTGTLELAVVGDWTVDWFAGSYVRQVTVAEPQRLTGAVASFEYDRQPYSLKVEVRERESRIRVTPTYSIFVEETQIRLVGNLKYTASGTRIREILLQAEGWEIDRVLPTEAVGENISLAKTTPLTIPLASNGKPTAEDIEIRIEAHQPIAVDDKSFNVVLPRTVNGVTAPAAVVVYPADNIDLRLRGDEIKGLIAESLPAGLAESANQHPPLYYVEEPSDAGAIFAGEFDVRSRVVAANMANTLTFDVDRLNVEQNFELDISYEPLRQLRFLLPEELVPGDQAHFFELTTEGPVSTEGGPRERALPILGIMPDAASGQVEVTIDLLEARITPCTITTRFSVPFSTDAEDQPQAVQLIRIAADPAITLGTSKLRLVASDEIDLELVSEGWAPLVDDFLNASSREQLFQTSDEVEAVSVSARLVETPQQGATVVEKFWLQTFHSPSIRQDRACFQVRTRAAQLQVQLPDGATLTDVSVAGMKQPAVGSSPQGLVSVPLAPRDVPELQTIELWYEFAAFDAPLARLPVAPPVLVGVPRARRSYWQLVLPRYDHLVLPPRNLTPEYVWRWNLHHWGRKSNRRQADLEAMLGATQQWSLPETSANVYLFTSVGPMQPVEFITASRSFLTSAFSLAVLVVGLGLIYFRWARHPTALLVAGVVVISVGVAFPEPTIICVQAASLGILFVLLAQRLHRNAVRRRRAGRPSGGSSISLIDSKQSFIVQTPSEGNSHTTTTLAPANYQVPIVEPKP